MKNNSLHAKLYRNIFGGYQENMLSDEEMIQLIELMFDLLGLKTYSQAAKDSGKSYNGIKNHHPKKIEIKGIKLVIDND